MSDKGPFKPFRRSRPRPPDVGPREAGPRRPDFKAFAVVMDDRVILRTPYNAEFVGAIKQVPAKLRTFVKDGRSLENALRQHLEKNEEYFSSHEDLATMIDALVKSIAEARGLSDSWAVALALPELFDWALGSALKAFPDLQLYDVRVLDASGGNEETPAEAS
jgi:hypothetical protein